MLNWGTRPLAAIVLSIVLVWAAPFNGALAQAYSPDTPENSVSPGDFGGIGLLQMRNARFGPDGLFLFGYSRVEPYKRWAVNIHILPWLETTFRYTEVRNKLFSEFPSFSGQQAYKDRGADIKVRLLKEGDYVPAVAIGLQDGMGTGLFAGEYLVASKRYRDLDFTLGLGWGYIGSGGSIRNPMRLLSEKFATRTGVSPFGGTLFLESLFSGPTVGMFGGLEYRTPIRGLTLKLEYDGHRYTKEPLAAFSAPDASRINYGFNFRPYSWLDASFGVERGAKMLHFSLRSDLQAPGITKFDPPPPEVLPRPQLADLIPREQPPIAPIPVRLPSVPPASAAREDPAGKMFEAIGARGLTIDQVDIIGNQMILTVSAAGVPLSPSDLRLAAAESLSMLAPDFNALTLIYAANGVAVARVTVRESQIKGAASAETLFRGLAELGLDVEGVEIEGASARITVAPRDPAGLLNFAAAARVAGQALGVTEAVVVDARTGRTETWVALPIRGPTPLSAEPAVADRRWISGLNFKLPPLDPPYEPEDQQLVAIRLAGQLQNQAIFLEALEMTGRKATVYLTPLRFRQMARNLGYAARITANNLPAPIEEITIVALNGGMESSRFTFSRGDLERAVAMRGSPEEIFAKGTIQPGLPGRLGSDIHVPGRYPRFGWSVTPQTRQHIGGPDQFILHQIWLAIRANLDITRGLSVTSIVGRNLYSNFYKIKLQSDSVLPHVRSKIKEYLQQGTNNIVRLQADYMFKPAEDLYTRISAGIFEEMFGGVSAEVLYRPFDSRLAVGLEINRLAQRAYNQRTKFLEYQVTSGHLTSYYDMPYKNLLATLSAGRYLAGDTGITFDLSRAFDSGVRVGAWATFTNVPAHKFGEGSFDKGFYFVIPFELFFQQSSTANGVFAFRPLFRDGGQRLVMANRLYEVTSTATREELMRDWPAFLK